MDSPDSADAWNADDRLEIRVLGSNEAFLRVRLANGNVHETNCIREVWPVGQTTITAVRYTSESFNQAMVREGWYTRHVAKAVVQALDKDPRPATGF